MPVQSKNTGPTKICPKCYPSLSSYAGASSASNSSHAGIPKEPSFSRKRKIPEHDRKVTFVTDFAEYGSSTSEDNMAMRFRAGYRRVNSGYPTTYQANYKKEPSSARKAPLINAAECKLHKRNNNTGLEQENVIPHSSKKHIDKKKLSPMRTVVKKKPLVEPLNLPPSANGRDADIGIRCEYPQTRAREPYKEQSMEQSKVPYKENSRDQSKVPYREQSEVPYKETSEVPYKETSAKKKISTSKKNTPDNAHHPKSSADKKSSAKESSKTVKKKKREFPSPLKKLYASDYRKHALAKGVFKTQYRENYKNWLGQSWAGGEDRKRRKEGEKSSPTIFGSPPILTDATDPRLLKHSPQPTLPHYPPHFHWKTQYETHFSQPSDYKYDQGVWKAAAAQPEMVKSGQKEGVSVGDDGSREPSSFLEQLKELRQKAEYNKWKSEHTSFNPHYDDHLLDSQKKKRPIEDSLSEETASSILTPSEAPSISSSLARNEGVHRSKYPPQSHGYQERAKFPPSRAYAGGDTMVVEDVESDESVSIADSASQLARHGGMGNGRPSEIARSSSHPPRQRVTGASRNQAISVAQGDVKCTCNCMDPFALQGGGHILVPALAPKESRSCRHHLDRTTPSTEGVLIYQSSAEEPLVNYQSSEEPLVNYQSREEPLVNYQSIEEPLGNYHSSGEPMGNRQSSEEPLDNHQSSGESLQYHQSAEKVVDNHHSRDSPVRAKRISASSSPYHAHCVPKGSGNDEAGDKKSAHHIRKLNFDGSSRTKSGLVANSTSKSSGYSTKQGTGHSSKTPGYPVGTSSKTPGYSVGASSKLHSSSVKSSSHVNSSSCNTCGASLRPTHSLPRHPPSHSSNGMQHPSAMMTTAPAIFPTAKPSRRAATPQTLQMESRSQLERIRQNLLQDSRSEQAGKPPDDYGPNTLSMSRVAPNSKKPSYGAGERDVDELSVSSMSLSSCSVASGILEKAKKRRDHFWTSHYHPRDQ